MQTETVLLNGQPFFLRRWGDPELPVLLLLHGFPEFSGAWEDIAPLLAQHFHCVAPDQRGFGQSWSPSGVAEYTGSKLVGDMSALITHLGRGPVTVFGHDWGAAVAYGLAMFAAPQVDRLIIANGVHPVPFQRALAAGGAQSEASQYMDYLRRPDSHDRLGAEDYAGLMALFSAKMDLGWLQGARLDAYKTAWSHGGGRLETMTNWYRASPMQIAKPGAPIEMPQMDLDRLRIRCPHLLLWGPGDTALLPETTDGLEAFAPDLTRVTVPDTDHWLIHQKPDAVAQAILSWEALS